jgi:signal transduction histidine kinase
MRSALMLALLAVSLGPTAVCLLIIRFSVQQEIRKGLDADLGHSVNTFRNMSDQRRQMLAREAALLADLPSLKALLATQDARTIQDGSAPFWSTSGGDFFALTSASGEIFTYSNRGAALPDGEVRQRLAICMAHREEICTVAFSDRLYELSIQPLYFGPPGNDSQLGSVVIGYAIDSKVARQIGDVAAADVAFLVDGHVSAATLPLDRLADLRGRVGPLDSTTAAPRTIRLGTERYTAAAATIASAGQQNVELVVLKSYDRASLYLRRVNQWILSLGICVLLIGVLLAVSISRTVTRPLEALVAGTRALGQGNFNYRLKPEGAVEVRELGSAFDRMRGELQLTQQKLLESDRLATIGRMASSVSHDLRHHLSAIYANAEFMSLDRTGAEERLELLLEVKDGVRGMTDLIESLLFFSHNGHVLQIQYEPMVPLLERTVHSLRQHPECRKVRIVMAESAKIEAWVDPVKLSRALYNLMLNACQAALLGAAAPVVTVHLSEDDERIRIAVGDTGTGIPESIRDTLFQPFVSSGKVNGTGLGLTIAQHIVQEHGGEIQLEDSEPGKTFFVVLLYKKALEAIRGVDAFQMKRVQTQETDRQSEQEFVSSPASRGPASRGKEQP